MFQTITLWIDPARGVAVQQQVREPSGDYRLTKYSNIQINQKDFRRRLQAEDHRAYQGRQTEWVRSLGTFFGESF